MNLRPHIKIYCWYKQIPLQALQNASVWNRWTTYQLLYQASLLSSVNIAKCNCMYSQWHVEMAHSILAINSLHSELFEGNSVVLKVANNIMLDLATGRNANQWVSLFRLNWLTDRLLLIKLIRIHQNLSTHWWYCDSRIR